MSSTVGLAGVRARPNLGNVSRSGSILQSPTFGWWSDPSQQDTAAPRPVTGAVNAPPVAGGMPPVTAEGAMSRPAEGSNSNPGSDGFNINADMAANPGAYGNRALESAYNMMAGYLGLSPTAAPAAAPTATEFGPLAPVQREDLAAPAPPAIDVAPPEPPGWGASVGDGLAPGGDYGKGDAGGIGMGGDKGGDKGDMGGDSLSSDPGKGEAGSAPSGGDKGDPGSEGSSPGGGDPGSPGGGDPGGGDPGFKAGGYTGAGEDGVVQPDQPAGTVHEGEVVIPAHQVDAIGLDPLMQLAGPGARMGAGDMGPLGAIQAGGGVPPQGQPVPAWQSPQGQSAPAAPMEPVLPQHGTPAVADDGMDMDLDIGDGDMLAGADGGMMEPMAGEGPGMDDTAMHEGGEAEEFEAYEMEEGDMRDGMGPYSGDKGGSDPFKAPDADDGMTSGQAMMNLAQLPPDAQQVVLTGIGADPLFASALLQVLGPQASALIAAGLKAGGQQQQAAMGGPMGAGPLGMVG